jgi:DinB superfamily
VTVTDRISRIETSVQQLVETVEALPSQVLYAEPEPSEWPVMSILAHVVELMPYWARQALEVSRRSADGQPFGRTHDDPDRIGAVQQHGGDSLDSMLPRVQTACSEAVAALQQIPPNAWSRTARHANRGDMSVEQIVDQFLVSHVEDHLSQARAAISALQA